MTLARAVLGGWLLLACSEEPSAAGVVGGSGDGSAGAATSGASAGGFAAQAGTNSAGTSSGGGGQPSLAGNSGSGGGGAGGGGGGPKASAGCGKAPGPTGEREMMVDTRTGLYIVSLPAAYDMTKAYPLGFGFHGRNRNHQNCHDGDCAGFQDAMGDEAVLVYMQSLREPLDAEMSGWESNDERDDNAQFFELVLAELKASYCVDEARVFVAGTSSGASFSNLLGCRYGDQLLAVGPVSGGLPEDDDCKGAPAAIVIHGIDDPHVPFSAGETARGNYLMRAGCMQATVPALADMHQDIRTKRDAQPSVEDAACVDYQGCAAASPIRWCEHSYGGYDGSTHGWPPVGGQMIWDFVKAL
jgi:poly(3-hydroxybutyrate) depolymerase